MSNEASGRALDIASASRAALAADASTRPCAAAAESLPGVFILSDVRIYREGLAHSLSRHAGITVLDIADISEAGLALAISRAPDAIILDIGTPGGFEVAKALSARLPATKIIACALREVDEEVLACAEAGIAGFVAADGSGEDLVAAVKHALRGELHCSPRMAGLLFRRVGALATQKPDSALPETLTRRERQVLGLLEQGMSNKEIARALHIGGATVKNHVHNILEKLQVHRRGEAAARLRAGRSWNVTKTQAPAQDNA
jgi:two-component system, NarL family, nitrate/nitrite response regulator NarL